MTDFVTLDVKPMIAGDDAFSGIVLKTDTLLDKDGNPVNHWKGRNLQRIEGIVYHISEGNPPSIGSVDAWFADPQSQVSAHFAIDRDGTIHQYVSSRDTAWSNGNFNKPNGTWIPWLLNIQQSGKNPNYATVSVEHIGTHTEPITPEQFISTVALSSFLLKEWNLPATRQHLLRHSDFDSVNRGDCPGDMFPLQAVITKLQGMGL